MSEQLAPLLLHCSHWYVNVGVGEPVQVPFDAVSVAPTWVKPLIVGNAVFAGAAVTAVVSAELEGVDAPAVLVAVTPTQSSARRRPARGRTSTQWRR